MTSSLPLISYDSLKPIEPAMQLFGKSHFLNIEKIAQIACLFEQNVTEIIKVKPVGRIVFCEYVATQKYKPKKLTINDLIQTHFFQSVLAHRNFWYHHEILDKITPIFLSSFQKVYSNIPLDNPTLKGWLTNFLETIYKENIQTMLSYPKELLHNHINLMVQIFIADKKNSFSKDNLACAIEQCNLSLRFNALCIRLEASLEDKIINNFKNTYEQLFLNDDKEAKRLATDTIAILEKIYKKKFSHFDDLISIEFTTDIERNIPDDENTLYQVFLSEINNLIKLNELARAKDIALKLRPEEENIKILKNFYTPAVIAVARAYASKGEQQQAFELYQKIASYVDFNIAEDLALILIENKFYEKTLEIIIDRIPSEVRLNWINKLHTECKGQDEIINCYANYFSEKEHFSDKFLEDVKKFIHFPSYLNELIQRALLGPCFK